MAIFEQIKSNLLQLGAYPNETAVSMGIIIPVLQQLGWPTANMRIVYPEYRIPNTSRNVDFGLCPHGDDQPYIIVEVKRVGNLAEADRQLFEYAFHAGAQVAILTDGKEWHFYFPYAVGKYENRRFYKLDLVDNGISDITSKFDRYLGYANVQSKKFLEYAKQDFEVAQKQLEALETIPKAFENLIIRNDSQLIQVIAEEVANKCGFSPPPSLIIDYLSKLVGVTASVSNKSTAPQEVVKTDAPKSYYYKVGIHEVSGKNPTDLLQKGLTIISKHYENSIPVFHKTLHKDGRKLIHQDKLALFPKRPDMAQQYARQLETGYWIDINNSTASKASFLNAFIKIIGEKDSELIMQ